MNSKQSPLGRNKLIECVNSPPKKNNPKQKQWQWQQQQYQPTKLNKKNDIDADQLTLKDDTWRVSAHVHPPKSRKQSKSSRSNRRPKSYGLNNTQAITTTSQQNNKTEKQQHSNNKNKKRSRASSHNKQQYSKRFQPK